MLISYLFIFFTVQPGIEIGDSDGQLFPQRLCGSWRRHCEQSLHDKICRTAEVLQAPWHCGLGTSGNHWAACALFPCSVLGIKIWPLNVLCIFLSMPLGFGQLCLILTYWSDWCWINFLVLF